MKLGLNRLPLLVKLVAVITLIACIGGKGILGYQLSGLGWFVPLLFSLLILLTRRGRIAFPLKMWAPWIMIVIIYQVFADIDYLQRSIMLLCPIIIGMTISKLNINEGALEDFSRLYKYMAIVLFTIVMFKSGIALTGTLPQRTGLAAEIMTGALLCALLAGGYAYGRKHELKWWFALATIPVIAVTRMGMIATGASLPLTLAPMNVLKRGLFILVFVFIGINLFYTERIQEKMFYSGGGTFQDLRWDNPDFATHGRSVIWEQMQYEIKKQPWFGHGANASEILYRGLCLDLHILITTGYGFSLIMVILARQYSDFVYWYS